MLSVSITVKLIFLVIVLPDAKINVNINVCMPAVLAKKLNSIFISLFLTLKIS